MHTDIETSRWLPFPTAFPDHRRHLRCRRPQRRPGARPPSRLPRMRSSGAASLRRRRSGSGFGDPSLPAASDAVGARAATRPARGDVLVGRAPARVRRPDARRHASGQRRRRHDQQQRLHRPAQSVLPRARHQRPQLRRAAISRSEGWSITPRACASASTGPQGTDPVFRLDDGAELAAGRRLDAASARAGLQHAARQGR